MPELTPGLEQALERSLQLAADRKHEYATLEHLLLALTGDEDAAKVLTACRVDLDRLRADLTNYLDVDCASFVVEGGGQVHPVAAFQRTVQRAVLHVESASRDVVTGANVLASMFAERDSHAVYFLTEQDMTRYDAVNFMSHGVRKAPGGRSPEAAGDISGKTPTTLSQQDLEERQAALRARRAQVQVVTREYPPPFYLIRISGIETSASIGIHGFEQAARQTLLVSVALMLRPPPEGDTIEGVQDYDFVREGVLRLVAERHFNLQETLCGDILSLCLDKPGVLGAVVQTNKPDVYPGVAEVACRMARLRPEIGGFAWWTLDV